MSGILGSFFGPKARALPPLQQSMSLENRKKMSSKMMSENPNRIPVVFSKTSQHTAAAQTPALKKTQFLVPGDLTVGEMLIKIKQHMVPDAGNNHASSQQAIFLFVGKGVLPPTGATLNQLYSRFADVDGFLYIVYSAENTFGLQK